MELTKLKGNTKVNVIAKSCIDWDKKISIPQLKVKNFLYPFWKNDVVKEEFVIPGSRLRIDLFNFSKKIAVEVSPDEYHVNFNPWLHKNRQNFLNKVKSDDSKREWCIRNNIKLVELFNENIGNLSVDFFLDEYNISL